MCLLSLLYIFFSLCSLCSHVSVWLLVNLAIHAVCTYLILLSPSRFTEAILQPRHSLAHLDAGLLHPAAAGKILSVTTTLTCLPTCPTARNLGLTQTSVSRVPLLLLHLRTMPLTCHSFPHQVPATSHHSVPSHVICHFPLSSESHICLSNICFGFSLWGTLPQRCPQKPLCHYSSQHWLAVVMLASERDHPPPYKWL